LIRPYSISPLSSFVSPISSVKTVYQPFFHAVFALYSTSIFLFKTQNNWTFQSWNFMGFDICQFAMFIRPLSWLQNSQLVSLLFRSAFALQHIQNIQT
jgi:hypothetical protein